MKSPKETLAAGSHHIKEANETKVLASLLKLTEISRVLAPPDPYAKKWYVFCILSSLTDLVSGLHSNLILLSCNVFLSIFGFKWELQNSKMLRVEGYILGTQKQILGY